MSELRWILLLVGVLFLIALTAWESRRARLARAAARERARAMTDSIPFDPLGEASAAHADASGAAGAEPEWLESDGKNAGPALGELPQTQGGDFPLEVSEPRALDTDWEEAAGGHGAMATDDAGAADETDMAAPGAGMDAAVPSSSAAAAAPTPAPADELAAGAASDVTVEWPPEEQRHIVSVRIVSTSEQRLSGRATRQALAACGFVHGRYRIFHQPDAEGHALLSCASLNKPGVFDPNSMDYQRYSGLSLFTVLPGPLSPPDAVDRLLHTALDLSERLQARLQDEAGQTLDEARIAELLTRYRELDAMAGPPA